MLKNGEATWDEGLLLFLERSGYAEETYHTFSYTPLADDDGAVVGMLCVVTEETERIIGERRLRALRELAADIARQAKADEAVLGRGRPQLWREPARPAVHADLSVRRAAARRRPRAPASRRRRPSDRAAGDHRGRRRRSQGGRSVSADTPASAPVVVEPSRERFGRGAAGRLG